MKTIFFPGALVAAALAALLACGRAEEEKAAPPAASAESNAAAPAPPSPGAGWTKAEGIAARVNGVEITRDEVERRAARIVWSLKARREGKDVPPEEAEDVRHSVLDTLISVELLHQEAVKRGFAARPEDVEGAFRLQKMRFAKEEHFQEALAAQGRTEAEVRAELARQIVIDKYLEEHVYKGKAEVTEEEALHFYNGIVANFAKTSPGQKPPRFEAQKRQIYEIVGREKRDMLRAQEAERLMGAGAVEILGDAH